MNSEDALLDVYNELTKTIVGLASIEGDHEFTEAKRDHYASLAEGVCLAMTVIQTQITKERAARGA
jgi:hypothetical protein